MKFALIFVMAVLVVTTHQYFHGQPMMQSPWLSPYSPHPFINKYQHQPFMVYYPRPHSPAIYPTNDVPLVINQQRNDNLYYVRGDTQSPRISDDEEPHHFADVQSRGKASVLATEEVAPRFFFGLSSTVTNPFFKTVTFTVSSTVSATSVVRCILAAEFVNAAAQATPCRRKRELLEPLQTPESHQLAITPTEPLMPTVVVLGDLMRENHMTTNQEIVSSKDDKIDDNTVGVSAVPRPVARDLKEKRFLFGYNANVFVASKTVTSFSFVSKTTTLTVDVIDNAGNALLRCLPYGFSVC